MPVASLSATVRLELEVLGQNGAVARSVTLGRGVHTLGRGDDNSATLLYASISLAADHEDRMPPAKKGDPLPKEQQDLIKQWIDEGADFGKWTAKKDDKKGDKPAEKKDGDAPAEKGDKAEKKEKGGL